MKANKIRKKITNESLQEYKGILDVNKIRKKCTDKAIAKE